MTLSDRSAVLPAAPGRKGLATVLLLLALIGLLAAPHFPQLASDSPNYIWLAEGHPERVLMPWAARILLPDLAASLARLFVIGLTPAFETVAVLALALWAAVTVPLLRRSPLAPGYWSLAILACPLVLVAFARVQIPDMLDMAGVAAFLAAVRGRRFALAAAVMLLLLLNRESNLALAVVAAAILFFGRERRPAIAILAAALLGYAVTHSIAAHATNVHDMPGVLYLILKFPANFLANFLGIQLWTDGFKWCDDPFATLMLPAGLHLGRIHQIGFCAPNPVAPLATLNAYATTFGILPAVLARLVLERRSAILRAQEPWWAIAFCYGALMTILGPMSGTELDRLVAYGWPLFLLAVPLAFATGRPFEPRRARLFTLHILALWLPFAILADPNAAAILDWPRGAALTLTATLGLALNAAAFLALPGSAAAASVPHQLSGR
jgi:hypothetical protein